MLNSHDYSNIEEEPTIPSFKIDLRSGRILNQFGIQFPKRTRINAEFRWGIGLGIYLNKWDNSLEITVPFFKIWVHRG